MNKSAAHRLRAVVAIALVASLSNAYAGGCGTFRSDISALQTQVRTSELNRMTSGMNTIRNASQQFKAVCIDGLSSINTTQFGPVGSNLMTQAAKQLCNQVTQAATNTVNTQVNQVTDQYGRVTGSLSNIGNLINSYQQVSNGNLYGVGSQVGSAIGGQTGATIGSNIGNLSNPGLGPAIGGSLPAVPTSTVPSIPSDGGGLINRGLCAIGMGSNCVAN